MRLAAASAWLTLTLALPGQFPIGHATASGGFAPALFAEPLWVGNVGYGYRIQGAPPGGSAVVGVSWARQDQLIGGLQVYLDLSNVLTTHWTAVDAGGRASIPFPLGGSDDPALTGLQLMAQAAVIPPGSSGVTATSEALLLEVALHPTAAFTMWKGTLWLLDPVTGQTTSVAGLPPTESVREMVFANAGRDLFITTVSAIYLVDTLDPSPHAVALASVYAESIAWDRVHHRVYAVGSSVFVVEGNRGSPAFGSIIAQAPNPAPLVSIAVSTDGSILALADVNKSVTRRNGDPASAGYLQNIPTPPAPVGDPTYFAGHVHVSPDGRVVSFPEVSIFATHSPVVHRFDANAGAWIDHDPAVPGTQPLSRTSHPALPAYFTLSPCRDGSGLVIASPSAIGRIDLDLETPANLAITTMPTVPTFPQSTYSAVTPSGRFLVRHTPLLTGELSFSFIQVPEGWEFPWCTIPSPAAPAAPLVAVWR